MLSRIWYSVRSAPGSETMSHLPVYAIMWIVSSSQYCQPVIRNVVDCQACFVALDVSILYPSPDTPSCERLPAARRKSINRAMAGLQREGAGLRTRVRLDMVRAARIAGPQVHSGNRDSPSLEADRTLLRQLACSFRSASGRDESDCTPCNERLSLVGPPPIIRGWPE